MEQRAGYGQELIERFRPEIFKPYMEWQPPTSDEITLALAMAGWSATLFVKKIGIQARTIRKWLAGEKPIHYSTWAILCSHAGLGDIW